MEEILHHVGSQKMYVLCKISSSALVIAVTQNLLTKCLQGSTLGVEDFEDGASRRLEELGFQTRLRD